MNRIPVLLCGNAKVFDGMVICTLSIVKYHTGPIDLFLFTMDLRERDSAFAPVTEEQRGLLSDILRKTNPQSVWWTASPTISKRLRMRRTRTRNIPPIPSCGSMPTAFPKCRRN